MNNDAIPYIAVGAILAALGTFTWKKQNVSILHSYQHNNVKEEDRPAYTRGMGIGQIVIGAGFCLSGVLRLFTEGTLTYGGLVPGLIAGFVIMHKTQMKYNGSWFS